MYNKEMSTEVSEEVEAEEINHHPRPHHKDEELGT